MSPRERARYEMKKTDGGDQVVSRDGSDLPEDLMRLVTELRETHQQQTALLKREREIVQQLIAAGASWTVVASCLDISRNTAFMRYAERGRADP